MITWLCFTEFVDKHIKIIKTLSYIYPESVKSIKFDEKWSKITAKYKGK